MCTGYPLYRKYVVLSQFYIHVTCINLTYAELLGHIAGWRLGKYHGRVSYQRRRCVYDSETSINIFLF